MEVDATFVLLSEQLLIVVVELFGSDQSVFVVVDDFGVDDLQDALRVKWTHGHTSR